MEEECWDINHLKSHEINVIRDSYYSQDQSKYAKTVFSKIHKILNPNHVAVNNLAPTKHSKKYDLFSKYTDFHVAGSIFSSKSDFSNTIDQYIPSEYRFLKRLETVSYQSNLPISEYLVTGYHQSGLPMPQYIAENELFHQLAEQSAVSSHNKHINPARQSMTNYLIEYERSIAKPLPHNADTPLNIHQFSDSISIIVNYMVEINNAIHKSLCTTYGSYPIQLDVFFVAPHTHQNLNLHALRGLDQCTHMDSNSIDGVSSVYRLLRKAAKDINRTNGQRFVMLIVRGNKDDSNDDTVYIFKPTLNNSIPANAISDSVELTWLLNSKAPIVPGLSPNDEGVLGFTHHLHSRECNKVYLSYGDHKSRVFKHDLLTKLKTLMDCHKEVIDHDTIGPTQWYMKEEEIEVAEEPSSIDRCSIDIPENTKVSFSNHYQEFGDALYYQFGEYWFNNAKAYKCYAPSWNPKNCRAMGNVFIPKDATHDLKPYIVESFDTVQKLFYKLDYTVAMQIVDNETLFIQFPDTDQAICVVPTGLHHKESGELLYAVIVPNTLRKNQRWKIIGYQHISEAFMTKEQLITNYGLFERDLPKGSKAKHNDFEAQLGNIVVTEKCIKKTNFHKVHIVQSNQNKNRMREHAENTDNGVFQINAARFKDLVLQSFKKQTALTPMAHIEYRKHQYHLAQLLPVYIREIDQYVAVSFSCDEKNITHAADVCFDITDMKNKANLIQPVPSGSWLNHRSCQPCMVKLIITNKSIPSSEPKPSPKHKSKYSTTRPPMVRAPQVVIPPQQPAPQTPPAQSAPQYIQAAIVYPIQPQYQYVQQSYQPLTLMQNVQMQNCWQIPQPVNVVIGPQTHYIAPQYNMQSYNNCNPYYM
eukprot:253081_1